MWLGLTLQWRAGSCWNADAFKICIARRNLCWRLYNALLTCGTALQINPLTHLLSCSFAPSFSPLVFYFLQKFFTTHGTHPSIINSPPVPLSSLTLNCVPSSDLPSSLLSCQLSHLRFVHAAICNHSLFPLFLICLPQTSLQPEHPHFSLPASSNILVPSFIFSFFLWLLFPSHTHFSLHF